MVVLVAIGAGITMLDADFRFESLRVATGQVGSASNALALFLAADFGKTISAFVVIPSAIAEVWMVGYLLVLGVRTAKPAVRPERECGAPGQPACELGAAV